MSRYEVFLRCHRKFIKGLFSCTGGRCTDSHDAWIISSAVNWKPSKEEKQAVQCNQTGIEFVPLAFGNKLLCSINCCNILRETYRPFGWYLKWRSVQNLTLPWFCIIPQSPKESLHLSSIPMVAANLPMIARKTWRLYSHY